MTSGPGTQVAIAVVSTNTRKYLEPCLESLKSDADAGLVEVWVVDNASSDGSPEMVERDFPWVRLIASDRNLGYGKAINLVAERTHTPWIAPSNEDIEVRPGAVERLLRTGAEHPEAAVVSPRLELPDGSTQHSVYSFPTLPFTLLFNLRLHLLSRTLADRLCLEGHWDWSRPRDVPWAIATFVLVRREAFEQVGRFSSDQFMYADDLDLGWRLSRAGWTARHEPRATVFHVSHAAGRKAFGRELRTRMMSSTYGWMACRRGVIFAWAVAGVNYAGAAAAAGIYKALAWAAPTRFAGRAASYRAWAHAHREGLRSRRAMLTER